jgi:hypothetical protein
MVEVYHSDTNLFDLYSLGTGAVPTIPIPSPTPARVVANTS